MAEGGKHDRHIESYQGSRCVERNDRQCYEARHLMDGWRALSIANINYFT